MSMGVHRNYKTKTNYIFTISMGVQRNYNKKDE